MNVFRLCLLAVFVGLGCTPRAQYLAVSDVAVVDVRNATVRPGVTVLIRDGRITDIDEEVELSGDTRVIDGSGKFLIPGLWDMHVHLAGLDTIPREVETLAAHGITGVRDMGGRPNELERLRDDIASGRRIGPQIFRAGPTLNGAAPADFHRVVATADDGRAAVRELAGRGVDYIKVHNQMAPDVFFAVADEADRVGLDVVGHVPHGVATLQASNAGMRSIEHVEVLMETELYQQDNPASGMREALDRLSGDAGRQLFTTLAQNGTAITPTLSGYREYVEAQTDSVARLMGENLYDRLAEAVGTANSAGVTILAGTDFRSNPGTSLHRELTLLVEAGLTPAEALRAATIEAAAFLGRHDEGVIAVGKTANMVLLDGNPFEDIRNIERVSGVVLRGRLVE